MSFITIKIIAIIILREIPTKNSPVKVEQFFKKKGVLKNEFEEH